MGGTPMAEGADWREPGSVPPGPADTEEGSPKTAGPRRTILGLAIVVAVIVVGFLAWSKIGTGGGSATRPPEGSIWFGSALNLVTHQDVNSYELVDRKGTFPTYSDVMYLASLTEPGVGLRMWLKLDGTTLGELGCDRPDGSVVVEGVLPDTGPGRWTIEITNADMQVLASGDFTVLD